MNSLRLRYWLSGGFGPALHAKVAECRYPLNVDTLSGDSWADRLLTTHGKQPDASGELGVALGGSYTNMHPLQALRRSTYYAVDGQYKECMSEFDRALDSLVLP